MSPSGETRAERPAPGAQRTIRGAGLLCANGGQPHRRRHRRLARPAGSVSYVALRAELTGQAEVSRVLHSSWHEQLYADGQGPRSARNAERGVCSASAGRRSAGPLIWCLQWTTTEASPGATRCTGA